MEIPVFYKTRLEDIEAAVKSAKKANVIKLAVSAGGRNIYLFKYGRDNSLHRTANLSSALGGKDISCFADKSSCDYRPTLLLVGCIHGGEFEGTAALLNLISIMETGIDLAGIDHTKLKEIGKRVNLLIIPAVNPDGRSHIPFDSFVGRSFYDLRYYNQGTWADGSLCGWPECKKVHPIKDSVDYLGGYFNDDGINLMHDNFFINPAAETRALFEVCEEYAPDFTVLLHGGSNSTNTILGPAYASYEAKKKVLELEKRLDFACSQQGLKYHAHDSVYYGENDFPPKSFNLVSALHHICGEPCVTYESNQGLVDDGTIGEGYTHEQIYRHHIILFEELIKYILKI